MSIRINTSMFMALFIVGVLFLGWDIRDQNLWTAEEGLGYAMGIVGSTMMALLLLYPLRKRLRFMHRWFPVKYWFGAHMLLGVLGPVIILFHSNFSLGSLNSNVALYSMLIVSLSGLLGRFFYVHIHKGLYGRKILLSELRKDVEKYQQELQSSRTQLAGLASLLDEIDSVLSQATAGLLSSIRVRRRILKFTRKISRLFGKNWEKQRSQEGRNAAIEKKYLRTIIKYSKSTRQVSEYMVYESLFAWWHVIHIPLFVILILSAIVHIFAVHMY